MRKRKDQECKRRSSSSSNVSGRFTTIMRGRTVQNPAVAAQVFATEYTQKTCRLKLAAIPPSQLLSGTLMRSKGKILRRQQICQIPDAVYCSCDQIVNEPLDRWLPKNVGGMQGQATTKICRHAWRVLVGS